LGGSFRQQVKILVGDAQPVGTHLHLLFTFFTGDEECNQVGQHQTDLQQQG
jgi:hypothetical protein